MADGEGAVAMEGAVIKAAAAAIAVPEETG